MSDQFRQTLLFAQLRREPARQRIEQVFILSGIAGLEYHAPQKCRAGDPSRYEQLRQDACLHQRGLARAARAQHKEEGRLGRGVAH
jgi:hypothetical protein